MEKHIPVFFVLLIVVCGVCAMGEENTALNVEVISPNPVEHDKISITVVSSEGQSLTVESMEALSQLKPGSYKIKSWIIERKDGNANTWQLKARTAKGKIAVIQGQTPKLNLGEPITAKLTVRKYSKGYRFDAKIKAQSGENIEVHLNNKRSAPVLRIINEPATYDERFTFSYG